MLMSEDITKFAPAFVRAQAEMESAKKDAANPHFKSRYATLEAVVDAVKAPLNKHGIAYLQMPSEVHGNVIEIDTLLVHESGQWMRSVLHVPVTKVDAQGVGSAISYGRRYALMAICGIAAEDDDGNAASEKPKETDVQHVERLIAGVKSIEALADLWKSPMVQSVVMHAPSEMAARLTKAKDERKAALSA